MARLAADFGYYDQPHLARDVIIQCVGEPRCPGEVRASSRPSRQANAHVWGTRQQVLPLLRDTKLRMLPFVPVCRRLVWRRPPSSLAHRLANPEKIALTIAKPRGALADTAS